MRGIPHVIAGSNPAPDSNFKLSIMSEQSKIELINKVGIAVVFAIVVLIVFCLTQMIEDPSQFNTVGGTIVK